MRPRLRSDSGRRRVPANPRRTHMRAPRRALTPRRAQEEAAEEAKRAKISANLGIVVRKPLSVTDRIERDYAADLRSRIGTKTLVNPDTQEGAGFLCKESGKMMRDSISYLDHINGKRRACSAHALQLLRADASAPPRAAQSNGRWACRCAWSAARWKRCRCASRRASARSWRRLWRSPVRARRLGAARRGAGGRHAGADARRLRCWRAGFDVRVAWAEEAEEAQRRARKERKLEKKASKAKEEVPADAGDGIDPEMAALMGFSGFGGGK
jgi:U4/U6.U5 tri-snRNP component SNU23